MTKNGQNPPKSMEIVIKSTPDTKNELEHVFSMVFSDLDTNLLDRILKSCKFYPGVDHPNMR